MAAPRPATNNRKRLFHDVDNDIEYVPGVTWLPGLCGNKAPLSEPETGKGIGTSDQKMKLAEDSAKVVYLLYHELSLANIHAILKATGYEAGSTAYESAKKTLDDRQASWDRQITTDFMPKHVRGIVSDRSPAVQHLSVQDRMKLWAKSYDSDPEGSTRAVFDQPIIVLDRDHVFDEAIRLTLQSDDQVRMKAVNSMFRAKYIFRCEKVYQYIINSLTKKAPRILYYSSFETEGPKDKLKASWNAYRKNTSVNQTIVPMKNLPVLPGQLHSYGEASARKLRKEAAEDHIQLPPEDEADSAISDLESE
ncbi:hypothetical protein BDV96DRAFT_651811 [Lophiotrema nucula]|uniref:Uncharacterized protein n=1 Tax=Lophiotrema nucula TaxID=690887 RepID=A0A6A5YQL2_9PLEO|nr:hypothetical protein BDV96DRAFT_651811 [Lophiotrema nucula]